jgi:Tol biopolymer transport system component/DNA-binding winged helix-turn-helix (wHTH) protein
MDDRPEQLPMNRDSGISELAARVDLARERDFALGRIEVRPSRRQIAIDGREQAVQPRVMQVLIAIARAGGGVISRRDLIASCWDGLVVSEDSINQSVAKVRRLAELGGREFDIETIPRIGYKLRGILPGPRSSDSHVGDSHRDNGHQPAGGRRDKASVVTGAPWLKRSRTTFGIVVALAAAGIAIGAWFVGWKRPAAPMPPSQWVVVRSEVPIATSLIERHPSISPDGTMIAYSAGPDVLTRKIFIRRVSGGDPLRLTGDPYDDSSPSWSPDGGKIAYIAYKAGKPCRIIVVPSLVGSPHEVAPCRTAERSHVVWSASGRELFFLEPADANGNERIMRFDLATGRRSQLTRRSSATYDESEPAVSPDGKWVAFCRIFGNGISRRVLLDLHTGAERNSDCNQMGEVHGLAFSANSKTLFTTTKRGGDYAIWAWPVEGGPPYRILSGPQLMERLSFGPNGLLAVEIARTQTGLARAPVSGSEPLFLESENDLAFTPDVSVDGTIAAALRKPNGAGVWIFPKSGSARKVFDLGPDDAAYAEPRWSPDGRSIAISSEKTTSVGVRIISLAGRVLASIPFRGSSMGPPAWEADGRSLIFPGVDNNVWRLWRISLDHGNRVAPLPYAGWTSIRVRGHELYGERAGTEGVWRIDGKPRRLTRMPTIANAGHWTIVDDEIVYVDDDSDTGALLSQPIRGGAAHLLARIPDCGCDSGVAWDPASHSFIYVAGFNLDADIELLHLARH